MIAAPRPLHPWKPPDKKKTGASQGWDARTAFRRRWRDLVGSFHPPGRYGGRTGIQLPVLSLCSDHWGLRLRPPARSVLEPIGRQNSGRRFNLPSRAQRRGGRAHRCEVCMAGEGRQSKFLPPWRGVSLSGRRTQSVRKGPGVALWTRYLRRSCYRQLLHCLHYLVPCEEWRRGDGTEPRLGLMLSLVRR
jgi:hypothetical protein